MLAVPAVLVAAGCAGGGPSAAPSATAAACTAAISHLPATVLGKARVGLDVPGAAAWGEPSITLRCGLPALAPTSKTCLAVNDVDWVLDTSADPLVAITYGRSPAVEVAMPTSYGKENLYAALVDVGPVAAALPANGHGCVG